MKEVTENYEFIDEKEAYEEAMADAEYENEEEVSFQPQDRKLYIQRQDKAIVDLVRMIKDGDILLAPYFQRNYVWSKKTASKFIESLLLNIPIPTIFVAEKENGVWDVVDGQQRLTAIYNFCCKDFALSGLETLTEYNFQMFIELEDKIKRNFNNVSLPIVIIGNNSSPNVKFDIFMRLNQGSIKLNEQELRNCLYRGSFMNLVKELGENTELLKILSGKKTFIDRLQHHELIIRYFAMKEVVDNVKWEVDKNKYAGRMVFVINQFLEKNRDADIEKQRIYEKDFVENIKKVYKVFENDSFKQFNRETKNYNQKLNRAVAELQMIVLSKYTLAQIESNANEIKDSFEKASIEDLTFDSSFVSATNNTSRVDGRYKKWGTIVDNIMIGK